MSETPQQYLARIGLLYSNPPTNEPPSNNTPASRSINRRPGDQWINNANLTQVFPVNAPPKNG
jgi:hypothetical protein